MSILSSLETAVQNKITSALPSLSSAKNAVTNLKKYSTPGSTGTATTGVGNFMYPANLTKDPDMQHWVTFYINVRGKSKIAKDPNNLATPTTSVPLNGENRLDPATMQKGTTVQAAATGALASAGVANKVGIYAGKVAFARTGSVIAAGGAYVAAAGATVAGAGAVAAAVSNFAVTPDTTYRLKDAITLAITQAPNTHYTAAYDVIDMGTVQGLFDGSSSAADSSAALGASTDGLKEILKAALTLPAGAVSGGAAKLAAVGKASLNPFKEVLFKQMNYRQFSFNYSFFPKSQAETDQIQQIIGRFKYHMHPELSARGLFYIHPSEFNIQYYYKGKENTYFNKISTCALVDMHVEYGEMNDFSSFGDGAPVEIKLSLTFQELETLTKERIDQGY
jgi:hypothetical protein